jgi:hypothetical protein
VKRRRAIVILILAAILVVAGAVLLTRAPEPSYRGKSLTAWIDDYVRLTGPYGQRNAADYPMKQRAITDAFKAMGTNCIPFIFQRLERQDSAFRTKYRDLWPKLPKAFQRILPPPKPVLDAGVAGNLISSAGPVPFRILFSEMNSRSSTAREVAVGKISNNFGLNPAQVDQVFPVMIARLSDSNSMTRLYSAWFLGDQGPKASKAVPALILALHLSDAGPGPSQTSAARGWVILALGRIGPDANSAVPTLTKLMEDSDPGVRWKAAAAIWRINSNVDNTLPVLVRELPASEEKRPFVEMLGEMGPRAKDAVPALEEELKKDRASTNAEDSKTGQNITNALLRIDPDTAARLGIKK